jgi:hypothetical protein
MAADGNEWICEPLIVSTPEGRQTHQLTISKTAPFIYSDTAQYYFHQTMSGQSLTFTVDFITENGVWKILEF